MAATKCTTSMLTRASVGYWGIKPIILRIDFFSLYSAFEAHYKEVSRSDSHYSGITGQSMVSSLAAYATLLAAVSINEAASHLSETDRLQVTEFQAYLMKNISQSVDHGIESVLHTVIRGFRPIKAIDASPRPIFTIPVVSVAFEGIRARTGAPELKPSVESVLNWFFSSKVSQKNKSTSSAPGWSEDSVDHKQGLREGQEAYKGLVSRIFMTNQYGCHGKQPVQFDSISPSDAGKLWTLTRTVCETPRRVYIGFSASSLGAADAEVAAKFWRFTELTGIPLKPISPEQDMASLTHTGLDAIFLAYTVCE